jgi:hypothetical protein
MQGDPLAMFGYTVGLLPLIRGLKSELPMVTQPWYAYDACAGATFKCIRAMFLILLQLGPDYGYYPELTKSILVVSTANFARANAEFADLGFKVMTVSRYLGGFIGEDAGRDAWLEEKIQAWEECIQHLSSVAGINRIRPMPECKDPFRRNGSLCRE